MNRIVIELLGLMLTAAVLVTPGCSPATTDQVSQVVTTADTLCPLALANQPLIQAAAAKAGVPLDEYVVRACRVIDVAAPMVRAAAEQSPVCPVPERVGAGGATFIEPDRGVAGSP